MTMLRRASDLDSDVFLVDADCHPQTIAVVATRAEPLGIKVIVGDPWTDVADTAVFGVLVQYPGSSGQVRDLAPVIDAVHARGGLACVAADLLALTLLVPPGDLGADVVVGTTQRFGVPLGFGGPHAAFLATRAEHRRLLPGRLVGVSVDTAGRPALRLALQTREQHIRREKATSNICTAQVLLAVMAGLYGCWHGPDGLAAIAGRVHDLTCRLAATLGAAGHAVVTTAWFDTITVEVPGRAADVVARAREGGVNLRLVDADRVAVALDETTTPEILAPVVAAFGAGELAASAPSPIDDAVRRTSPFLTHPVFHQYRSETEMMRYLKWLSDRDLALDRAMIPLGSCTMKLNAAAEMEPVSWPEFAAIHPFAPPDQSAGYRQMIGELEQMLLAVTGYDAVSVQPNSGAQGEYAGLLAIRRWHESRGEGARDVCLIPSSAHGTNAASAVMAGMRVVVVACDADGNIDIADLTARIAEHRDQLAALMITYPSTHGVFEPTAAHVCEVVHDAGGQVYVDGANLNALVGVAPPGRWGADVSHLNLHKTFCIPHGGGGPGVGPVACKAHLAPFLPNHPLVAEAGPETGPGPIAAAPWGSAGILPISWMYVTMMGGAGLAQATALAVLNANYVATRLADHYPILYRGERGLVAHECIIDLRPFKRHTSVDDVAKRLVDYGFHAPTMSFPVAGTLMIEPTESESVAELDRFCDAMIAIRAEIDRVAGGEWPPDDNPLVNAPHTAVDLMADEWTHPYSRRQAAFPADGLAERKYWAPVSRIDGGYGDRHLVCACPPPEAFETP
jgi:glycine dehydrogenase